MEEQTVIVEKVEPSVSKTADPGRQARIAT